MHTSSTLDFLHRKYGPVLTLEDVAEVLSRKPQGVRMALSQRKEAWAMQVSASKVHIGRRVYFPAEIVAALIAGTLSDAA